MTKPPDRVNGKGASRKQWGGFGIGAGLYILAVGGSTPLRST